MRYFAACLIAMIFLTRDVPGIPPVDEPAVNWLSIDDLEKLRTDSTWDIRKKKIFIDFYTDWCGWCRKMDQTTFRTDWIVRYLNDHFYVVRLNAETRDTIRFNEKLYTFIPSGNRGYNEIAAEFLGGRLSYPSFVFMDEDFQVVQPIPGYQDPQSLIIMLTYFADDYYKKMPWETYQEVWQSFRDVFSNPEIQE